MALRPKRLPKGVRTLGEAAGLAARGRARQAWLQPHSGPVMGCSPPAGTPRTSHGAGLGVNDATHTT